MRGVIGVTGGVGAGKSTVLALLSREFGLPCLRTDELAKSLYVPGSAIWEPLLEILGSGVLGPDGGIDRQRMAAEIYADAGKKAAVNALVHPAVWQLVRERVTALGAECAGKLGKKQQVDWQDGLQIDASKQQERQRMDLQNGGSGAASSKGAGAGTASCKEKRSRKTAEPIMLCVETALPDKNFVDICDEIWFIYTQRQVRVARLMTDRGYSRERAEAIIAAQPPDEAYRALADFVLDNSGSPAAAAEAARARFLTLNG